MNDTIYVAVKLPITTHPQKCRIGVCEGMPTIDDGWQLFSYVVSNDADNIYSNVIDTIIDVKETNFDLENKAWILPANSLDKLMILVSSFQYSVSFKIASMLCLNGIISSKAVLNASL